MDRSTPIYLVTETYTADAIGQRIPTLTQRKVYANVGSVSRAEWSAAGERGIKPEYMVTMFEPDYNGEKIVQMEIRGSLQTFGVYRTYRGKNETIELYLEWKVGDSNGTVISEPAEPEANDGVDTDD